MTAADLIQLLMKDENIDKDIVIVQRKPALTSGRFVAKEMEVEDVKDFTSRLELMVDLPEPDECDERHADDEDCNCWCEVCEDCTRA